MAVFGCAYIVVASIVAFDAPGPLPAGLGLGPSWVSALSRAAREHLIFGRDIVYTYGPLGYLVTSIANVGDFGAMVAMQVAVAALIVATLIVRLREPASGYQKILLVVFFSLLMANGGFDTWPPLLALVLLSRRARPLRFEPLEMLGAGAFAGFFLLTKFTAGVDTALPIIVYFAARLFQTRGSRPAVAGTVRSAMAFVCGLLATSAAKFFEIDYGTIAAGVLDVVALGFAARAVWPRLRVDPRTSRLEIAMAATSLGLLTLFAALCHSYRDYLMSSARVALGYSSGEALVGPLWQVAVALLLLSATVIIAAFSYPRVAAPTMLGLLAYEWTVFKLGFVRQDEHVLAFFEGSAVVALLLAYTAPTRRSALAAGVLLIASLAAFQRAQTEHGLPALIAAFAPSRFLQSADLLAHVRRRGEVIDAADIANLANDTLPRSVLRAVGDRPVDVVPMETEFAFANRLHWDPEPVFQSYVAYTPALDNLNRESLERRTNDAILYSYDSIDGRYPLADEPATFRYVLCHYGTSLTVSHPVRDNLVVLLRARATRCGGVRSTPPVAVGWGDFVAVPHRPGMLTFAGITTHENLGGRMLGAAFRAPIVTAALRYNDGTTNRYRLVEDNARDGVLVDPAPRDANELVALLGGRLRPQVTSIMLVPEDRRWFDQPTISFFFVPFSAR